MDNTKQYSTNKQSSPSQQQTEQPHSPPSSSNPSKTLIVLLAILLLALVTIITFTLRIKQNRPVLQNNQITPQPTSAPTIDLNRDSTGSAAITNWNTLTSRSCLIEVKYPNGWNASDLSGTKQGKSPKEYCIKITAPNYTSHFGEEGGGVIYITRITLGSTLEKVSIDSQAITVNSIGDYKRYLEEQFQVQNLGVKTYNYFSGNIFSYSGYFGYKDVVSIKDGYLYSVQMNDPFIEGDYKNEGDQILSTFRFD